MNDSLTLRTVIPFHILKHSSWSCTGVSLLIHAWSFHPQNAVQVEPSSLRRNAPGILRFAILKCWPYFSTGVPHASTESDQYLGYHIPKGAFVMVNLWSVPFSCHQFAFGSPLLKYPSGDLLGTLKYMMTLNLFVLSASSTASSLIQGN